MGFAALAVARRDDLSVELAAIRAAEWQATAESAAYCNREMLNAELARDGFALVARAVDWCGIDGLALAFGVRDERRINHMAELLPFQTVYGFDRAEGGGAVWQAVPRRRSPAPMMRSNVAFVEGPCDEMLPPFLIDHPGPIGVLHLAFDLYGPTRMVLNEAAERIVPGTTILFEAYFNYPGWQQQEFRAFQEFVRFHGRTYEYLGLVPTDQQVCVRITG